MGEEIARSIASSLLHSWRLALNVGYVAAGPRMRLCLREHNLEQSRSLIIALQICT